MEVFGQLRAGRLKVHQQRDSVAVIFPVLDAQFDPCVASDCDQVGWAIGRATKSGIDADRIEHRCARHDF